MRPKNSSICRFRQRIPRDVLHKARGQELSIPVGDKRVHKRISTKAEHLLISLETRDPATAKERHTQVQAYVNDVWNALRHGPKRLTHKQTVALAGELYVDITSTFENDPGLPARWEQVLDRNAAAARGEWGAKRKFLINPSKQEMVATALGELWGPWADKLLQRKGIRVDERSWRNLVEEVARLMDEAAHRLKANAERDYSSDGMLNKLPQWEDRKSGSNTSKRDGVGVELSLDQLFARWWQRRSGPLNLSKKTKDAYGTAMTALKKSVGHNDAARVTAGDVRQLRDQLLSGGRSAKTVRDSYLAGIRSIFNWAVDEQLLSANPAANVKQELGQQYVFRSKGHQDSEIRKLLDGARQYRKPPQELQETADAKRWVPWLCAFTGARIGEIVQLRKQDIRPEGDELVLTITPEAGDVKNKTAREVPVHPELVKLGFRDYWKRARAGYLFVRVDHDEDASGKLTALKNRLRKFARTYVADPKLMPFHGLRHRFYTVGTEIGIAERVLNAICGHAPSGVAERYGDVTLTAKVAAINRIPRINRQ